MKKALLVCSVLLLSVTAVFAQCDKKVVCKSKVGRFVMGATGSPEMSIEATIALDKDKIEISMVMEGQSMSIISTIKSVEVCEWKEYLKNGQSVYKVSANKGGGTSEDAIIKVVAKDGKLTVYLGSDPDDKGGLELQISDTVIE